MTASSNKEMEHSASIRGFSKFVTSLSKVVDSISKWGLTLACIFLAAMMFLTFFDVISTQLGKWSVINSVTGFFRPIIGGQELMELMLLLMVSFGLAYCAVLKGHIRVDLIMQYASRKVNLWFDILAYGVSFIFFVFITWQSFVYGLNNITDGNVSTVLTIPMPPFNFLVTIGAALVALVFLRDFLKSIDEVTR
jgi:TRAP-type C4-dicarboxylate transport system permease small subunit